MLPFRCYTINFDHACFTSLLFHRPYAAFSGTGSMAAGGLRSLNPCAPCSESTPVRETYGSGSINKAVRHEEAFPTHGNDHVGRGEGEEGVLGLERVDDTSRGAFGGEVVECCAKVGAVD